MDRNFCPSKNIPQTLINTRGQGYSMGSPYPVSGPDPVQLPTTQQTKLDVFTNLLSVTAARSDTSSLNIAFDYEYQSVDSKGIICADGKERIILSYQFALYLNETEILEVIFLTKRPERASQMLPIELIQDLLQEMNYIEK